MWRCSTTFPSRTRSTASSYQVARQFDLPLVCDNDAHFLNEEDHDAHDTLICISTGKGKTDPNRMRYPTQLFVKSEEQMVEMFTPYDERRRLRVKPSRMLGRSHIAATLSWRSARTTHQRFVFVCRRRKLLLKHDDKAFSGDLTAWYSLLL